MSDRIKFIFNGMNCYYNYKNIELCIDDTVIKYQISYKNHPKRLYIIFSKNCNLSCIYCFQHRYIIDKQQQYMHNDVHFIMDVLKNNLSLYEEIVLFGGEPLLIENYDILSKLVTNFKDKKYIIFTNGNFEPIFIDFLNINKDRIIKVIVTIDGPKDIHNKFRINHKADSFDLAFKNFKTLYLNEIPVQLQINVNSRNIYLLDDLFEYIKVNEISGVLTMLNPIKYSVETLKQSELIKMYLYYKSKYSDIFIEINSRLFNNFISIISGKKIYNDRCGINNTAVFDFSTKKIYACPQNENSFIGNLQTNIIDYSNIENEINLIKFKHSKCIKCYLKYLCPFCCPYSDNMSFNCQEEILSSIKVILSSFDFLFCIER